jgi:hypothetical protein
MSRIVDLDDVIAYRIGDCTYAPDEVQIIMRADGVSAHAGVAEVGAASTGVEPEDREAEPDGMD